MKESAKFLPLLKFAAFAVLVCLTSPLQAQSKVGTTIGQFLKIGPSARNAAMGSAGVSAKGEAMASFYNPASLGHIPNIYTQFTHSEWLADINYQYLTAAIPLGSSGTIALQLIALNSGEIDVRTVEQPLGTGERYTVTNFALGAGYGKLITGQVSIGFQINYLRETIWHSSAQAFSLNLGVQYQLWQNGPAFGASVSNYGPRTGYNGRDLFLDYDLNTDINGDNDGLPAQFRTDAFALPTMFRAGISFPVNFNEENRVTFMVDALHPNDNTESLNMGAEWQVQDNYFLRGGYRNLFVEDYIGGVTLGGGLNMNLGGAEFSFDYAWVDYGVLEQTQRFTLGFQF